MMVYASIQQMLDGIYKVVKEDDAKDHAEIKSLQEFLRTAEKQRDEALVDASLDVEFHKDDAARESSVRKEQARLLSKREAAKNKAYTAAQETIAKLKAQYYSLEGLSFLLSDQIDNLRNICGTNETYIAELEKERKVLKERASYKREHDEEERQKLVNKVSELEEKLRDAERESAAAENALSEKDDKLKKVARYAKDVCDAVIESTSLEKRNAVKSDIIGYLQGKNVTYDNIESCVYNAVAACKYLHTDDMQYIIRGIARVVDVSPLRAELLDVLPTVIEAYATPRWFARLNANFSQGLWNWFRGMYVCPSDTSLVKHVQNFVCGYNDVAKGKQQAEAIKAHIESLKNMNDYVLFTS